MDNNGMAMVARPRRQAANSRERIAYAEYIGVPDRFGKIRAAIGRPSFDGRVTSADPLGRETMIANSNARQRSQQVIFSTARAPNQISDSPAFITSVELAAKLRTRSSVCR
jgi:hypothetical protein